MIAQFTAWLLNLFLSVFTAFWDIVKDLFVAIAEIVFVALAAAINAIPAPDFLSQYSLSGLLSSMPDYVLCSGAQQR